MKTEANHLRALLRYKGGKWKIAKWVIDHFPAHETYAEIFGGAASVLLQKPRAKREVYNDINSDVVNLFEVIRNSGDELARRLRFTPYSRKEYLNARRPELDPTERARKFIVRAQMGYGSGGAFSKVGFNTEQNAARNWANYPTRVGPIAERLKGVIVECLPATKIIDLYDSTETLFYADPPYVMGVRPAGKEYPNEMTDAEHAELIDRLKRCRGMVVLSGYPNELYNRLLADWFSAKTSSFSVNGAKRTEVLWLNSAAKQRLNTQLELEAQ